jgi:hypothetical protein
MNEPKTLKEWLEKRDNPNFFIDNKNGVVAIEDYYGIKVYHFNEPTDDSDFSIVWGGLLIKKEHFSAIKGLLDKLLWKPLTSSNH